MSFLRMRLCENFIFLVIPTCSESFFVILYKDLQEGFQTSKNDIQSFYTVSNAGIS